MQQVKLKKLIIVFLTILIVFIFSGCREDTVVVENLNVRSEYYQRHGYFIGNDRVEIEVELAGGEREDLVYYWQADGGRFLSQGESSVTYVTPRLPGNYNLTLEIRDGDQTLTTFNYSFVVEGDYPEEVVLERVENRSPEEGIELEWSQYLDDDFYGYKILRSENFYIDDRAEVVASIDDKETTIYSDEEVDSGERYTYQVMVTNELGYASASNEKLVRVLPQGFQRTNLEGKVSSLVVDSERERGYIGSLDRREIMEIGLQDRKIKGGVSLNFRPHDLFLTKDKNWLVVLGEAQETFGRMNLETGEIEKFEFENDIKDLAMDGEYVYLLTSGKQNLHRFNVEKGKVEEKFSLQQEGRRVSGDRVEMIGSQLLLVDKVFGPLLLYDISDLKAPIDEIELGSLEKAHIFEKEDGLRLYLGTARKRAVQKFELTSDKSLRKVGEFNTEFTPADFALDQELDILVTSYETKEVTFFSLSDYSHLRTLKLDDYVFGLALDQRQNKLYVLTADIGQTDYKLLTINLELESGKYIWKN